MRQRITIYNADSARHFLESTHVADCIVVLQDCDHTCESSWTICKLSTTLCWLDTCDTVKHAVTMCLRRALVFPLYRTWDLACKVVKDVACIVSLGRVHIVKALLQIKTLLASSSERYILNNLYLDDYCCWLQSVSDDKAARMLNSLSEHINAVKLERKLTGWDLETIEREGREEVCICVSVLLPV